MLLKVSFIYCTVLLKGMISGKDNLFSYVLTVGFVLLILVFLVFVVQISRFVLSDAIVIQEHVANTKGLLEDITEVEKFARVNNVDEKMVVLDNKDLNTTFFSFTNFERDIDSAAFVNMNENKGVLSIIFNSSIGVDKGIYYLNVDNLNDISKDDMVLYRVDNGLDLRVARVFLVKDDVVSLFDVEESKSYKVGIDAIVGKIILRVEK